MTFSPYGFNIEEIKQILSLSPELINHLLKEFSYYVGKLEGRYLIDDYEIKDIVFEISREFGDIKGKIEESLIEYFSTDLSRFSEYISLENADYFNFAASLTILASALYNNEKEHELYEIIKNPIYFEAIYSLNRGFLLSPLMYLKDRENVSLRELMKKHLLNYSLLELSLLAVSSYLKMDDLSKEAFDKSINFLESFPENRQIEILSIYIFELGKIYLERYGMGKTEESLDELLQTIGQKLGEEFAEKLKSPVEEIKSQIKKIFQGEHIIFGDNVKLNSGLINKISKTPSRRVMSYSKEEIDITDPYHLWTL